MRAFGILLIAALVASPLAAQDAAQDAALEQAVDSVVQKFSDAWNAADAAGIAALFAEDGDLVGFGGASSKGRAAIEEVYKSSLNSYQGSSAQIVRTSLHVVSTDVVVTDGTWEIAGGTNTEGAPTKGFYTLVLAKQGDDWTIVSSRVKVPPAN